MSAEKTQAQLIQETHDAVIMLSGQLKSQNAINEMKFVNIEKFVEKIHTPDDCTGLKRRDKEVESQRGRDRLIMYLLFGVIGVVIALINLVK